MKQNNEITAFVIAGGKSKRFGQDKLLYEYRGKALIEHAIDVLKSIFADIVIIANDEVKFKYLELPVYPDIIPDVGPLGGIYTALDLSKTSKAFCFASDMPNLNPEFIEYMKSFSKDYDIVVPYINNYYEALHAIYSKNCLPLIKDNISNEDYKIIKIFNNVSLKRVEKEEIERFVKVEHIFKNINYMKDLE